MRELLERHFQPPEAPRFRVQECRIEYLRGVDGPRVAVQYNLQLEDIATGRVYEQVVSGLGYGPGRTWGAWESLGRPEALPEVMGLPSYSYLAELDLLIQLFPFDYRMPALASVMAGPPTEILPPILATFGGGAWQVEAWESEPIRYRVDQRATLGLRLLARDEETGRSEGRRFYLKLYRDRAKRQRAFASQRTLFEGLPLRAPPSRPRSRSSTRTPSHCSFNASYLEHRCKRFCSSKATPLYRRSVPRPEPSPPFTSFRWRSRQRLPLMRLSGSNARQRGSSRAGQTWRSSWRV